MLLKVLEVIILKIIKIHTGTLGDFGRIYLMGTKLLRLVGVVLY